MSEKEILNKILLEIPKHNATAFRANAGQAWCSNDVTTMPDGSKLLRNPRPLKTLVPGFSDIFGFLHDTGQFFAIEVKAPSGKTTDKQKHFLEFVSRKGGRAGVAYSVEDAKKIIERR